MSCKLSVRELGSIRRTTERGRRDGCATNHSRVERKGAWYLETATYETQEQQFYFYFFILPIRLSEDEDVE